jgi:glutathione S-transferase
MKFFDCATAPSPRRVRIFLAEKGITVPTVQVDLRNNEQLTPAFRAINPDATVPALELDDGTRINDAIGICVYFEAIQPRPALMGESAEEKAVIAGWQREVERNGFYAVMEAFRNTVPGLLRAEGFPARTTTSKSRRWPSAGGFAFHIFTSK